jgi:hypothetical protein
MIALESRFWAIQKSFSKFEFVVSITHSIYYFFVETVILIRKLHISRMSYLTGQI